MVLWFRKKQNKQQETIGFEPEEQKTPLLGRILLVILTVVLLYFGWAGLSDLGKIPERPERLSDCSIRYYREGRLNHIERYKGDYLKYDDIGRIQVLRTYDDIGRTQVLRTCVFSQYEKETGVSSDYKDAQLIWQEKDNFSRSTIEPLQKQLSQLRTQISKKENEYNTSLREVTAGQPPVSKTPEELRQELQTFQKQEQSLSQELARHQVTLNQLESKLGEKESILVGKINKAIDLYNKSWAGYKFWVFLLEMTFALPFFAVSVWFYFKLLRKNSPHTIILLPVVSVGAILVARNLIIYFWASFLADLIAIILQLAGALLIFRVLIFYFGMFLAIVIFGGAVFLLQKRIYAPQRVKLRRLKAKRCPHCETPVEFTKKFCAGCGSSLIQKCPSCDQDKFIDFKFCPHCGRS
ncbi:zinc ribbon domain-containing protein [Patescibacteria group bacterium]|nr:zinc ribbon domain-containing protein [Patescibacteria group bacterium]